MSLFFSELASELQSNDQEIVKFALIKLGRITPSMMADKESYQFVSRLLRDMVLSRNHQFTDLIIRIRDRLDKIFSLIEFLDLESHTKCIKVLNSEASSEDQILKAIIASSECEKLEDLELYRPFLANDNPMIRCATLEVFHYHGQKEHLIYIVKLIDDKDIKVKKLATRVLNRFGRMELIYCLNNMINSNEEEQKISAIQCLANLKTNLDIVNMLKKCSLPGSHKVRSEAIRALKYHNCNETIELLQDLKNDMSIHICELAHETLNKLEPSLTNGVQIKELVEM